MEKYKHTDITWQIIGCAMKVHRTIGLGFPEIIYLRSLMIELNKAGLKCESEIEKDVFYDGIKVGSRRLDVLVENVVVVELKAVDILEPIYASQILNYLNVFKIEVGLLINFGSKSLQYKRYAKSVK